MKHLLKMSDLTREELFHILDVADELKADRKAGRPHPYLAGKTVALIFAKASTRTRTSFEVGVYQLGGLGTYLNATTEMQIGRGEPIQDTARVLGRYYDGIMIRTFKQSDVEALAQYSGVPVINGLTDYCHPCQVLADLQTIREFKGGFEGRKACFIGDGNNMANSLIVGCLMAGMSFTAVCPEDYRPAADVLDYAQKFPGKFQLCTDPKEGAVGADVLFTDVWTSMGEEAETEKRRKAFRGYQINEEVLALANPGCMVQHCLPAHRGEEITAEVFEAHAAEIFEEAENRLHAQKAVMAILMGGK
ncbi:MAG: ornithine carbamoyltransferase [Bacteroidales bacterium]|nr:ornithine carbamoyltransferase [Fournierella massiliensis]MCF2556878.1 ornithine carbamoyltransferase [Fournierella massiliensis]MCI6740573.1 ornithine carbamoyltransferase [Bacteroidales bacterium]